MKFRGVPSGRVARIGIAPDSELIEVQMDIDPKVARVLAEDKTLRATLELSGITGLRYLEIDRRSGSALDQAPELRFEPPYPLIPSARSSFKAIQEALSDIYDRVMQVDLRGISDDIRTTLQSARRLLDDERIDSALTHLNSTIEAADQTTRNLQEMTAGVRLAPAIDHATQAAEGAHRIISELAQADTGRRISQTVSQMSLLVQTTQQAVVSLQSTLQRLDRAAGNLQGLTGELRAQPSRLLFGGPPVQNPIPEGDSQ